MKEKANVQHRAARSTVTSQACNPDVQQYLDAALASNTLRAYRSDLRHFAAWGGQLPATPEMIANYVAHFAQGLASSTLSRRLVAIARAHTEQGWVSPTDAPLVRATLKGVRRARTHRVRQVDALQKADIVRMVKGLSGLKGARDAALLMIGFAGAFRRSELVSLDLADVHITAAGTQIRLVRSKTDQEGRGREVFIPRVRGRYCPSALLTSWLAVAGIESGPVFRRINRHGQVAADGLSGQAVALIVKAHAAAAGLDAARFSGHSLRAGFVTNATGRGASISSIRRQTGHQSDAMVQHYIRSTSGFKDNPILKIW